MFYSILPDSPVGPLRIAGTESGLKHVAFGSFSLRVDGFVDVPNDWERDDRRFREPIRQLKAYFRGRLTQFSLPIAPDGTDFQLRVWKSLCSIPWGETASYGDVAAAIGQPTASRAVGLANGRNPLAIIVPCHRVIGRSGRLVGFGGGLKNKEILLRLEGAWPIGGGS